MKPCWINKGTVALVGWRCECITWKHAWPHPEGRLGEHFCFYRRECYWNSIYCWHLCAHYRCVVYRSCSIAEVWNCSCPTECWITKGIVLVSLCQEMRKKKGTINRTTSKVSRIVANTHVQHFLCTYCHSKLSQSVKTVSTKMSNIKFYVLGKMGLIPDIEFRKFSIHL